MTGRKPRPLRLEEIPVNARAELDFDNQIIRKKQLHIKLTCSCGETQWIKVITLRRRVKRKSYTSGCSTCCRRRPLRPEEVPNKLQSALDFSHQRNSFELNKPGSLCLHIQRTCLTCGQQNWMRVINVRGSLKRNTFSGTCISCNKQRGANSSSWRGGRCVAREGYILVRATNHPHVNSTSYIFEHRLVMEKMIGRYLLPFPEETVNHKNGLHDDNRPENLELRIKGTHPPGILPEDAPHCPTCRCSTT